MPRIEKQNPQSSRNHVYACARSAMRGVTQLSQQSCTVEPPNISRSSSPRSPSRGTGCLDFSSHHDSTNTSSVVNQPSTYCIIFPPVDIRFKVSTVTTPSSLHPRFLHTELEMIFKTNQVMNKVQCVKKKERKNLSSPPQSISPQLQSPTLINYLKPYWILSGDYYYYYYYFLAIIVCNIQSRPSFYLSQL